CRILGTVGQQHVAVDLLDAEHELHPAVEPVVGFDQAGDLLDLRTAVAVQGILEKLIRRLAPVFLGGECGQFLLLLPLLLAQSLRFLEGYVGHGGVSRIGLAEWVEGADSRRSGRPPSTRAGREGSSSPGPAASHRTQPTVADGTRESPPRQPATAGFSPAASYSLVPPGRRAH